MDVPDRLLADRSDACSTSARSTSGSRPTRGRAGRRSARTSRATIRRRWATRAGRSRKDETGVETYATVFSIAPSPKDGNLIWTGSDDGYVQVTRDGGTELEERDAEGPAATSRASASSRRRRSGPARRTSPRTAISTTTSRPTSTAPTTTARRGRRSSTASRRTTSRARSAKTPCARSCCTSAPSTASTSRSTTARTGSRCGRTCPTRRCTTSRSRTRDLVIATHGRGFYVMDDISPLRQWGAADDRAASLQAGGRAARPRSDAGDRLHAEAARAEGHRSSSSIGQGNGDPHASPARPPTPRSRRGRRRRRGLLRRPPDPKPPVARRPATA